MHVLAVIKESERPGQKKAAGRMISHRVAFGVEPYGISLAEEDGGRGFVAFAWGGKFWHLKKVLMEKGIKPEEALRPLADALLPTLGLNVGQKPATLEELDDLIKTMEYAPEGGGIALYRNLKPKFIKRGEYDWFLA